MNLIPGNAQLTGAAPSEFQKSGQIVGKNNGQVGFTVAKIERIQGESWDPEIGTSMEPSDINALE